MTTGEEVVRGSFEAFNRADWEALEALWEPDGVIVAPEEWPEGGVREGWSEVLAQFQRLKADWQEDRLTIERLEPVGEGLTLVHYRWAGSGAASGLEFDTPMWMLATIPNDRYIRAEYFMDEKAARAAAEAAAT